MLTTSTLQNVARAATVLGGLSLAVMILVTDYDIFARVTFHRPFNGVVNIVEMLMLCVAFLGLPEVCLRDEQIRVDIIDGLVPPPVLFGLKVVGLVLTVIIMAILSVNVFHSMLDAYQFGDFKPDIGIPTYPLFVITLASFFGAIVATVVAIRRLLAPDTSR
jgi:TRAP-type C4-dicarboxylate transport system permease small subunit